MRRKIIQDKKKKSHTQAFHRATPMRSSPQLPRTDPVAPTAKSLDAGHCILPQNSCLLLDWKPDAAALAAVPGHSGLCVIQGTLSQQLRNQSPERMHLLGCTRSVGPPCKSGHIQTASRKSSELSEQIDTLGNTNEKRWK